MSDRVFAHGDDQVRVGCPMDRARSIIRDQRQIPVLPIDGIKMLGREYDRLVEAATDDCRGVVMEETARTAFLQAVDNLRDDDEAPERVVDVGEAVAEHYGWR